MLKRTALAGLGLVLLVTPLLASADTLSDLQAQVSALLAQINQLKSAQSTTATQVSTFPNQGDLPPSAPSTCVDLQNNIGYRSTDFKTGGDVSELQDFLQTNGYLNTEPTGFYGQMTVNAIKSYQTGLSLNPTGYTGPLTRGKIKDATCGGATTPAQPTPQPTQPTTSGTSPVRPSTVSEQVKCVFNGATTERKCYGTMRLADDFQFQFSCSGVASCVANVKGSKGNSITWRSDCVGSANTTIDGNNESASFSCGIASSFTASPASGSAPLKVAFFGTASVGIHYILDFGDGSTPAFVACAEGCTSLNVNESHVYTAPGSYVATLKTNPEQYQDGHVDTVGTATIIVTNSNSNVSAPVVKGIEGPASLNAGQTGTWTVIASVPNQAGAQLRYSVQWSDEGSSLIPMASSPVQTSIQTSATFTHIYKYNGVYKPKFTVSNSAGSASAEMAVTVTFVGTPTLTLTANPTTITAGQSATLSWKIADANRCVLQYGASEESVPPSGSASKTVSPLQTTSYKLWCANDPGTGKDGPSASQAVTVTLVSATDTTQPVRSSGSPTGITPPVSSLTLSLQTNEPARCKYVNGSYPNTSYWGMNDFSSWNFNNSTDHSTTVNVQSGANTFYVRCMDNAGNINTDDYPISFTVQQVAIAVGVQLALPKPVFTPGEAIHVTWSNPGTTYPKDWVTVVKNGEAWPSAGNNGVDKTWVYTDGLSSGTKTLIAPTTPGNYQLVYYVNDTADKELARTSFTVQSSPTTSSDDTRRANLASSATALESALKSLLQRLR
ncbi:MAG: peptidoglycan-binding protein [bacterium]|nr:peptidoglycan-binding protein [bacterium]